ncbi:MAG TPA: alkaline phosphatase, partial [bacterium]|nr:alkaline phosphatase [bacterium]
IGFGPSCDGRRPLETIASEAMKRGMSVGIVSTTRVTHATPAGFYANVVDRNAEEAIASQLVRSGIDVVMGGGCRYLPDKLFANEDAPLLVKSMKEARRAPADRKIVGCFAESHIPYALKRKATRYSGPSLAEMTRFALERISKNPNGFFLMVEGGRIDHAAHQNLAHELVAEVLEFDDATKLAARMAPAGDTLFLVTADHETGGLAINGYPLWGKNLFGSAGLDADGTPYPILTWATGPASLYPRVPDPDDPGETESAHTAVDVPLFGFGLKRPLAHGTIDNTEIHRIMREAILGGPSVSPVP